MRMLFRLRVPWLMAVVCALTSACHAKTNAAPQVVLDTTPLKKDVKAATSYAPIIRKVTPSVVNIYSTMSIKESARDPMTDDLLRRFFGGEGQNQNPRQRNRGRQQEEQGLGSGVIVSPDGYILTANHVVENADRVKVALSTGEKEFEAKVIGTDPPTDIAVLKIEVKRQLPAIPMTDSDKIEVGDTVLAIGNPFAVGQTVTMGIVSGLGRGFGITEYENFIQTDAAINPGNSGGALVDAEGRLVGINTAILSRSGGFMGVGFAVPINIGRFVMDQLVTQGKVTRGFLGVGIQSLTSDLARGFGLPDESSGVLVSGVNEGSAAEKAGVKDGDVIIDYNGQKVDSPRSLRLLVSQTPPGSKVTLRVLRGENGGKAVEKDLSVKLGEFPKEMAGGKNGGNQRDKTDSTTDALDGVEVTDLDSSTRRQTGVPTNVKGAIVTNVDPNSNSSEAGLRVGDVITEINRQPVKSAEDAVSLSEKAKGDRILLRVWSAGEGTSPGGSHYVSVDNSKKK